MANSVTGEPSTAYPGKSSLSEPSPSFAEWRLRSLVTLPSIAFKWIQMHNGQINLIERAIFSCNNFRFAEFSHVEDQVPLAGLFFETLVRVIIVTINKTRDAYY
jgi:hypothetical protein